MHLHSRTWFDRWFDVRVAREADEVQTHLFLDGNGFGEGELRESSLDKLISNTYS